MSTWIALRDAGYVTGEPPSADEARTPWFVRLLVGFGGWTGALFMFGFIGAALASVLQSAGGSLITGALACALVVVLFRGAREANPFLASFGFAVSLAGQALMAWGLSRTLEPRIWVVAAALAAQQAALFFLVRHPLHRVWCAATAASALAVALFDARLAAYATPALFAALAWLWVHELDAGRWSAPWRAAAYGFTAAALFLVAYSSAGALGLSFGRPEAGGAIGRWPGLALTAAVLVAAALRLLAREGIALASPAGRGALVLAAILAAATLKAPGIAVTVAVLVLGFANGNRLLAGIGIAALLAYLSHYYYALDATLLEKSMLLAAAGVGLLAARLMMRRIAHA